MNLDSKISINKNFELVETEDEIICVPIITSNGCQQFAYFIVNNTSKEAIRQISVTKETSVKCIFDYLLDKYNVTEEVLYNDLVDFFTNLVNAGVLRLNDEF